MAKKLRKFIFRILLLLFILGNISACLHGCAATKYKAGATPGPPFSELTGMDKWKAILLGRRIARPQHTRNPADVSAKLNPRAEVITHAGGNISYWAVDVPNPKGIVIALPDYGRASDDMLEAASIFNALGYSVAAIDFRGTGKSEGNSTTLGKREAIDVEVAFKRISDKSPGLPVILYGAPMGAGAAMKAQYFGRITPAACIYEAPYDNLTKFAQDRIGDAGMPKFLSLPVLIWGGVVNQMNPFNYTPDRFSGGVECPVLFLRGENDKRVSDEDLTAFADRVPAGMSSTGVIPGADHTQLLSRANPDEWSKQVRSFLATLDRKGAGNLPGGIQNEFPASPAFARPAPSRSAAGDTDTVGETVRPANPVGRPAATPPSGFRPVGSSTGGNAGEWQEVR